MRLLLLNLAIITGCVTVRVVEPPAGPLQVEPHADPTSDGIYWTA